VDELHDLELQTDPIARVLAVCLLLGLVWLVASPLLHTFHRPLCPNILILLYIFFSINKCTQYTV
jgi:hypothetical protein